MGKNNDDCNAKICEEFCDKKCNEVNQTEVIVDNNESGVVEILQERITKLEEECKQTQNRNKGINEQVLHKDLIIKKLKLKLKETINAKNQLSDSLSEVFNNSSGKDEELLAVE